MFKVGANKWILNCILYKFSQFKYKLELADVIKIFMADNINVFVVLWTKPEEWSITFKSFQVRVIKIPLNVARRN